MFDSIPGPLQAIVWPLAGAAIILVLGRLLPGSVRRLLSLTAALVSLAVLWSLRAGGIDPVEIYWQPLNFFRMSPTLHPDSLALTAGLTLAAVTAAGALGIRGPDACRSAWHGLILVALAGGLVLAMASNLLGLVLGSALIDLALMAVALSSKNHAGRVLWRIATPGVVSTVMLFFGALQMDTQVGNASLSAQDFPIEVPILLAAAGMLRMLIFPLHPRGLNTPDNALISLLPVGSGIFLLARVQAIAPVLMDQSWMLTFGGAALLVGGFLAWAASVVSLRQPNSGPEMAGAIWPSIVVQQTGYALVFSLLVGHSVPWPLLSLTLVLAQLAIWWSVSSVPETSPPSRWHQWIEQQLGPLRERAKSYLTEHAPALQRWRRPSLARRVTTTLATIGLASLAGAPLTAGGAGRWSFYATLLHRREAGLLIAALAADTLLSAALWIALGITLKRSAGQRPRAAEVLSMLFLTSLVVAWGIAPGNLIDNLGLPLAGPPDVSAWGLGLIFALPWLLGGWLARIGNGYGHYLALARRIAELDWFYRAAGWVAQRLVDAIGWLGRIGEGEGWWGWALIILALGTMFLTIQ